jgi:hypothetical protein
MANTPEPISVVLGNLRTGLIDQGYTQEQAFQIVLDLIRRGDSPLSLVDQLSAA